MPPCGAHARKGSGYLTLTPACITFSPLKCITPKTSRLNDMYKTLEALKADIKEREEMLKKLPSTGMADPDTGEVLFPPARSSKTTIKTTFKKQ